MKYEHEIIGVIGLGYVGLPVAIAFAKAFQNVIGFDINERRVKELNQGVDETLETEAKELQETTLKMTSNPEDLKGCTFFVIAVPTSIDIHNHPDLGPVRAASRTVGNYIEKGGVVCLESTVYPGVTENIVGCIVEEVSQLKRYDDFKLGYSPERINPGDKIHRLENTVKVVAGQDEETLERVASVYQAIIEAGVYRASSIKVAEAAKVSENTQRDINIALMNELALVFQRLGIRTADVLEAANTKWNFLPFSPGLVGGHCIGIDPYYLTTAAQAAGYHPEVILSGRRINDSMGEYVASRTVKLLIESDVNVRKARVGILGMTFKENCPDIRNSRVPDIIHELNEYGIETIVCDPVADERGAKEEYQIDLVSIDELQDLDGIILAVKHDCFCQRAPGDYEKMFDPNLMRWPFIDVKSVFPPDDFSPRVLYWSL